MIILIVGGIGDGKTITCIREMLIRQRDCNALPHTNFHVEMEHFRLKYEHFVHEVKTQRPRSVKISYEVNYDFWEERKNQNRAWDIWLDEFHNVCGARNSMSVRNRKISEWGSQIRKYLMEDKGNNLYLVSQTLRKIDVDFRDLASMIIKCMKVKLPNTTIFINQIWKSKGVKLAIDAYEDNEDPHYTRWFVGEPLFKYYSTHDPVRFGQTEYV